MGLTQAKTALITGGSTNIGKGIAMELAAGGYDVAITYLYELEAAQHVAQTIAEQYGRRCVIIQGDLSDPATPDKYWNEAIAAFGTIDLLVNNAAYFLFGALTEMDTNDMQRLMQINFLSGITLAQKAGKHMIEHKIAGSIINITSSRAERAYPHDTIYGSMKAGMKRATEVMAIELAPYGIRVNCVGPGAVAHYNADPVHREKLGAKIPLGRMGTPEDIANAVAWLSSDKASYVTGITLRVDGGLILPGMPEDVRPEAGYGWGQVHERKE